MEPQEAQLRWIKVELGAMAIMCYSTFLRSLKLKPYYPMKCHI